MRLVYFLCSETLQVAQILWRARTARPRREPDYFSMTHLRCFSVTYAHISEAPDLTVRREIQMSKTEGGKKVDSKLFGAFVWRSGAFQRRPGQHRMQRTTWPLTGGLITGCNSSLVTLVFLVPLICPAAQERSSSSQRATFHLNRKLEPFLAPNHQRAAHTRVWNRFTQFTSSISLLTHTLVEE